MDAQQSSSQEKLLKIIDSSTLSPEDKKLLSDTIPNTPADYQTALLNALEKDAVSLDYFIKNLKMKIEALNNPDKLQQILDEERGELTRALLSESQ